VSEMRVDHEAVLSRTSGLRNEVSVARDTLAHMTRGLWLSLDEKDGAASAGFRESAELLQQQVDATARGLDRLLLFISGAASQMQLEDARMARTMSGIGQ